MVISTYFVYFCAHQVFGESAGAMLGRDLEALIQRAREYKKEYRDSFVSVEHLVLGFFQDKRFGKQLFNDFQISLKTLTNAIQAIRGRQTVIDQGNDELLLPLSTNKISYFPLLIRGFDPTLCSIMKFLGH